MSRPNRPRDGLQPRFSTLVHNAIMNASPRALLCATLLVLTVPLPLYAQDTADADPPSSRAEESDEAYRRRMELEDARRRDLGYTLPPETYAQQQEKIDQLPQESREHIQDQLIDVIVDNGDWEPADALREYPYEATAAAREDPELMRQEQEAWDEQIEKYHKREAAAYGTYLGPLDEPGEAADEMQGDAGASAAGESGQGPGQTEDGGEAAAGATASTAAGTYQPYQSNRDRSEAAVSTAGVEQNALEFLQSQQAPATAEVAVQAGSPAEMSDASSPSRAAAPSAPAEASETPQERATEMDLSTPGIIPIEDLEKLKGTENPDPPGTIPPDQAES